MPRQNREKEAISHESKVNAGGSLDGGSGIGAIFQRVQRAIAKRLPIRFPKRLPVGFSGGSAEWVPVGIAERPEWVDVRIEEFNVRIAEFDVRCSVGLDDWFAE